jgi:hypothetical protein
MLVRPDCMWRVIKKHGSSQSPCDQWVHKAIFVEKVHYNVNMISEKMLQLSPLWYQYTIFLPIKFVTNSRILYHVVLFYALSELVMPLILLFLPVWAHVIDQNWKVFTLSVYMCWSWNSCCRILYCSVIWVYCSPRSCLWLFNLKWFVRLWISNGG